MVAANFPSPTEQPDQHCNQATLLQLLDETLQGDPLRVAESHLSSCVICRQRLETLVADPSWWQETRSVYTSHQQAAVNDGWSLGRPSAALVAGSDAMLVWLRSILRPDQHGQASVQHATSLGTLDRYRIDSIVGSGGMGVVVAGYDQQLARPVAIKFLAPHLAGLAPARRRFAREARAAAAITHPAIMPIYGVNENSHPPYLVMPLIGSDSAGRSLQDRINDEGPLPLETAIDIAAQIAEGLAAAHERGVIHRDIKPGNVLLEENSPRILIGDFGLARAIDDATVTVSGMVTGTPQYMSPEQAAGDDISRQSDLFSLGSVLYAMITGRPPFTADSPIAVLRKVIDTQPRPATVRIESLPAWVDRLLERFLAKNITERIATADDAARLLRKVELHLRQPSANELPSELQPPTSRRGLVATTTATLTAIALAVATLAGTTLATVLVTSALTQSPSNDEPMATQLATVPSTPAAKQSTRKQPTDAPPPADNDREPIWESIRPTRNPVTIAATPPTPEPNLPPEMLWLWPTFPSDVQRIHNELLQIENQTAGGRPAPVASSADHFSPSF
ncbi:serine/threonine protein kinase [Stieleria sp. TO1_6]|uniref:serine/threonine-protein kinase n=1 Tax=Stieleria tagensis TaxID=2956795 RepID=UPI00209B2547|nr:serine/threonine-protein kinase [Stieleria tagensis]MCO8124131.1 serine/threonine protein kinase [Stieleria tagensis]